jgi:hypothetical protein
MSISRRIDNAFSIATFVVTLVCYFVVALASARFAIAYRYRKQLAAQQNLLVMGIVMAALLLLAASGLYIYNSVGG